MIDPANALKIILDAAQELGTENMPLAQSFGYVLAEDIYANHDVPPFDNSAMDGFAIKASDTEKVPKGPVHLRIIDDQPAGKVSKKKVTTGTAIKIMTGAPIPGGADSVIPVEDTSYDEKEVTCLKSIAPGANIRPRGEDISQGSLVFKEGHLLEPIDVGLLASLGLSEVKVVRKPKVAIIGTGDEIVDLEKPLSKGEIRDSNSYVLYAQTLCCGAQAKRLGTARDNFKDVENKLKSAEDFDVIVTTGGVSVGERDFVKDVLKALGAEELFWKVAQKPGMPLAFWLLKQKLVFGLPGNPVAAVVCFEEYIRPVLLKMMGRKKLFRPLVKGTITHGLRKKPGRLQYFGVEVEQANHEYFVKVKGPHGSGILRSFSGATGIAVIPSDTTEIKKGDQVLVQLIGLPEDH